MHNELLDRNVILHNPIIPTLGVVFALIGLVLLFSSRKEAMAAYRKLQRSEIQRQSKVKDREAKRMAIGGWSEGMSLRKSVACREGTWNSEITFLL